MKSNEPLKEINAKIIENYIKSFQDNERYLVGEKAIETLFKQFNGNDNIENVLLKVSALNDIYSTNIFNTFDIAKHIVSLENLDLKLSNGDVDAVHRIATGHNIKRKDKEIFFYSFATKYCHWHNPNAYCIYDSFVEKILIDYLEKDDFYKFNKSDLKDYSIFKDIIYHFQKFYDVSQFSLKEIDKFLWMYGKERHLK